MTQPLLLPHARALITRAETTGYPIGDHVAPKSATGKIVAPCAVLYLRPGGQLTGSIDDYDTDGVLPFQFTCVGHVASQALDVADKIHTALKGSPLVVADRYIGRLTRTYLGAVAQRDDDVTPPLYYVPAEYRMLTSPATEESS